MSILKVARLGHPILRGQAQPVIPEELKSSRLQSFIDHMIETMREYAGVGLAATQVHVPKQIAVIEVNENPRYPDAPRVPLIVLINPKLVNLSNKTGDAWEGCLSIPDLRGLVPRSESLLCEAWDRTGKPFTLEAQGFFSRVVQHEWDHLQGKVYLDRMPDLLSLTHLAEFARFWANKK